ncbi:MAG: methyl-accepting chemotaxis protein [Gemmatimonadales bacterium]
MIARPLRKYSLFVQLFGGSLIVMIVVFGAWFAVEQHFVGREDAAADHGRVAISVAALMAEVQQHEGEGGSAPMLLDDTSDPMAPVHGILAKLAALVDTLNGERSDTRPDLDRRISDAVAEYSTVFEEMGRLNKVRGARNESASGIDGQWRRSVSDLSGTARRMPPAVQAQVVRLVQEQRDAILKTDPELSPLGRRTLDSLRVVAASDADFGRAVGAADSLFRARLHLSLTIGVVGRGGLRDKIHITAGTITASLDTVRRIALEMGERARGQRNWVTLLGLGIAIGLCGLYIRSVARYIAAATLRLAEAAESVGRGAFDARVDVQGGDELGRLGAGFNAMAENLGNLVGTVRRSGIQLNSTVMEIAATSHQQQATAGEIAATTTEISATARTISTTAIQLSQSMVQLTAVAERTASLAGTGQGGIERMQATMGQITDASHSISSRLVTLSEKAGSITSVVTTIAKVADQTNLLSLNAAIEAEKAGEYGRGFAVVAAEIRRLADQTALATGDIERIVKEMQGAVTAGVMGMEKFSDEVSRGVQASSMVGDQLSEIIEQVQSFVPSFDSVNRGMQSQSEGAKQISDALVQLGSAVQQTADSLIQSGRAIGQLNEASQELQQGVMRFSVGT